MESIHPVAPGAAPRGFTLAEMMVVLTIIVIVTIIALSGQGNFNKSLTVTDTAYTVALSIRQAQSYGLASRTSGVTSNAGYGIHFATAAPSAYLMFVDTSKAVYGVPSYCPVGTVGQPDAKPGNCMYDPNQNEVSQNFAFSRGFIVSQLCGHDTGGILRCSSDSTAPLTAIDILFIRPNTNSIVTGFRSTGSLQLKDAQIKLTAPVGNGSRYICVTQVGEISVASSACP
ncbi:MAG: prepilin-type N-terminal cleavage/methylation domain-containing protein [Bacillota bacterium]